MHGIDLQPSIEDKAGIEVLYFSSDWFAYYFPYALADNHRMNDYWNWHSTKILRNP